MVLTKVAARADVAFLLFQLCSPQCMLTNAHMETSTVSIEIMEDGIAASTFADGAAVVLFPAAGGAGVGAASHLFPEAVHFSLVLHSLVPHAQGYVVLTFDPSVMLQSA